ncbi:MAG TPA: phosphoenolpyruvate carboxykinase (ATP), partial [Roseiflexaceae bacterium]|nr:phosphoenolpyruvate carboxykinase (ATP) [Roseiflexaceae bacterium]
MTNISTVLDDLHQLGISRPAAVHVNLSVPQLVEAALARGEGMLAASGALVARTGKRTGRSPGDKFVVRYDGSASADRIDWGKTNQPMSPATFERLRARINAYLQGRELFVVDSLASADPRYDLPVRLTTEFAWHALFARQLFRRMNPDQHASFTPAWHIISAP